MPFLHTRGQRDENEQANILANPAASQHVNLDEKEAPSSETSWAEATLLPEKVPGLGK